MPDFLLLAIDFFFTGLFAVGGGLATIPFLQRMGPRRGWFSQSQLADMIAVADVAPGPIGTNMAAFVGHSVRGIPGAAVAVFSLMLPTIAAALSIAALMERFKSSTAVQQIMRVIRPAGAGLICAAAFALLRISLLRPEADAFIHYVDWRGVALYAALLPFAFWKKLKKLHPIAYIAIGAVVGIFFL